MITLEDVKANQAVQRYMIGNEYIGTIGAIEHSLIMPNWFPGAAMTFWPNWLPQREANWRP